MTVFSHNQAFDRNIGWITEEEFQSLKNKRVAIAGLGGVGGYHLMTLLRMGITKFNLAEMDDVELVNFNRQVCATVSNIGRKKLDVLKEMALDVNPQADLRTFPEGVNENNLTEFLKDADIYIDGLDFFVLDIRRKVFQKCRELGIPAITAAPLGMGTAALNFLPDKMSFEEYFDFGNQDETGRYIKFMIGLSPAMLQKSYLVDMRRVDFKAHKGPSTPMACQLCAGVAGTEAVKILINRPNVKSAPSGYQFDAYRNKFKTTWRPWGNKNPLQKLMFYIVKYILSENEK